MDGTGGTLISTKKLERVLSKLKYGKGSLDQITADVLMGIPSGLIGKTDKIAVSELPGRVGVLCDGSCTKKGGCKKAGEVQADRWFVCNAK